METYDFGLRLRELREKRKLSQSEVASRLNLERATISGYERNVTTPSLEVIKSLALLYNTSSDYLLGLTDRELLFLDDFNQIQKDAIARIMSDLRCVFQDG